MAKRVPVSDLLKQTRRALKAWIAKQQGGKQADRKPRIALFEELAKAIGVPWMWIFDLERGTSKAPNVNRVEALYRHLAKEAVALSIPEIPWESL